MGVEIGIASVGLILLLGFLGEFVFRKTNIPSVLWLLILGLLLGPVLGVVNPKDFIGIVELFAAVAIAIIVFEGGLGMDVYSIVREAKNSVALTLLAFALSVAVTSGIMLVAGFSAINSILMGVIVGGTNSAIVIPGISRIRGASPAAKALISLETAINDVVVIIMFIVISQLALAGSADILTAARTLVGQFSIGAIIGILIGLAWLPLYHRLAKVEFSYVVTLSLLLLMYSGVELMQGSGPLAALLFGVVLGNARQILRMFRVQKPFQLDKTTREFHSFVSFITRTFFFVYIGILVSINGYVALVIGIAIGTALLVARYTAVRISTSRNKNLSKFDRRLMSIMLPRGLTAAVLAYLPASRGIPGTGLFADIVFTVIITTVIIYTAGTFIVEHKNKPSEKGDKQ